MGLAAFTLPPDGDASLHPDVRPAFLQTKVPVADSERMATLVRAGYLPVETAVTLEMPMPGNLKPGPDARFAVPADEGAVRAIARTVFRYSRFHADSRIPDAVAHRIKENWAGGFFAGGRGTHMVVAAADGGVAGFLLLICRGDQLIIDLVGVAADCQGRGIGRAMLDFAAANITGPTRYVVGTQLHNIPSLAYYTGYGFRIVRANHSLHRHVS
jgi:GNAT superfamily N-acetyltransferase